MQRPRSRSICSTNNPVVIIGNMKIFEKRRRKIGIENLIDVEIANNLPIGLSSLSIHRAVESSGQNLRENVSHILSFPVSQ
jgi:hypothetical protein